MPKTPHDILAAALARRGTPEHRRMGLGRALTAWLARAGDHACPTEAAAEAYLESLVAACGPAGAQSRFATFQIAAGYTWGAHETRHLARVLRSRLVAPKPDAPTGAAAFASDLARLPDAWRGGFRAIIATNVAGGGGPGAVHWSEARIQSVIASSRRLARVPFRGGPQPGSERGRLPGMGGGADRAGPGWRSGRGDDGGDLSLAGPRRVRLGDLARVSGRPHAVW